MFNRAANPERIKYSPVILRELRVAFVIPNLLPFGGNSGTVIYYIEEATKQCEEVFLLQSYNFNGQEIFPLDRLRSMRNVKVITLRMGWYKIIEPTRRVPFGQVIHYLLYKPFVLFRKILNKSMIKSLGQLDGLYLFDFVDSDIFPKETGPVIVGTHNQIMGPMKVMGINTGILLKRANGLRLFDSESKYKSQIKNKQVRVIPKGVNTSLFYPRDGHINDKVKFLFVARLEPRKGLDTLLQAWKNSQVSDRAELHIVGTGRLARDLSSVEIKGMTYHGPLYDKDLQEMYRACDVFIFPTEWDAQPTVIVEAVASGLYVLCSDYMKGVYDDFERSAYLEYVKNDVESFTKRILAVASETFDNFEIRKEMHKFIASKRNQKKEVEDILSFMKELKVNQ